MIYAIIAEIKYGFYTVIISIALLGIDFEIRKQILMHVHICLGRELGSSASSLTHICRTGFTTEPSVIND